MAPIRTSKRTARQDEFELTPAQAKELRQRAADSSDPRRYLIISRLLPGSRFVLYYNVSDDVYAWNEPEGGTLFKRRQAATLIQRQLQRGNEVIEVKVVGGKVVGAPRRRPTPGGTRRAATSARRGSAPARTTR